MQCLVEVDVCVERPPTPANCRTVAVLADGATLTECELVACQMAACGVVMPVASRVIEVRI